MEPFTAFSSYKAAAKPDVRRVALAFIAIVFAACGCAGVASAAPTLSFESFSAGPLNADGSPATQAAGHPFELTTAFALDTYFDGPPPASNCPVAGTRDTIVELPPGVIRRTLLPSPSATRQNSLKNESCPADTAGWVCGRRTHVL